MRYLHSSFFTSTTLRLGLVNFLLNLSIEASIVFLPLYARDLGASNLDVGLIAAAYGLAFFASSFIFGRQSDMHGRVPFILAGLGLSGLAYLAQIFTPATYLLLIARGFVGFGLGIASAALAAYTYESQKRIGPFASYGAMGWLIGAGVAALMGNYTVLFLISAISSAIAFFVSLTFKDAPRIRVQVSLLPMHLVKGNLKVYLPFMLRQIGAIAIWSIFPLFLVSLGASKTWIALFDVFNNGTQFIIMRYVERFNPARIFRIGLLISALVFIIYGISPGYLWLIPVQVLLGIAWSCMFVGAFSYLFLKNPERGTAGGMLYSTIYLSNGLGPFVGGFVSQIWGFVTLMYVGAGLTLTGLALSRGLSIQQHKK